MRKKDKLKIEKREIIFSIIGIMLIVIWFVWLREIVAPYLEILHPFLAMIIYNSGLFFGLYLLAGILNGGKIRFKGTLITFFIVLGVDILYAPYLVLDNGEIFNNFEYWYVSTDVGFGSLYNLIIPSSTTILNLNVVWFLTYIVTPIILILIFPIILLKPRTIAKIFGH